MPPPPKPATSAHHQKHKTPPHHQKPNTSPQHHLKPTTTQHQLPVHHKKQPSHVQRKPPQRLALPPPSPPTHILPSALIANSLLEEEDSFSENSFPEATISEGPFSEGSFSADAQSPYLLPSPSLPVPHSHEWQPSDVASDILENNAESAVETSSESLMGEGGLNLQGTISTSPSIASTDLIELPKATNEGVKIENVERTKKKKDKTRKKNKWNKNKKKVPSPVISYKVSSQRFQQLKAAMVNKGEKDILRSNFSDF